MRPGRAPAAPENGAMDPRQIQIGCSAVRKAVQALHDAAQRHPHVRALELDQRAIGDRVIKMAGEAGMCGSSWLSDRRSTRNELQVTDETLRDATA
jgi:hypothetical protein